MNYAQNLKGNEEMNEFLKTTLIRAIGTGLPEVKSADELTVDEVDSGDDEVSGYDRVGDTSDVE